MNELESSMIRKWKSHPLQKSVTCTDEDVCDHLQSKRKKFNKCTRAPISDESSLIRKWKTHHGRRSMSAERIHDNTQAIMYDRRSVQHPFKANVKGIAIGRRNAGNAAQREKEEDYISAEWK